MSEDLSGEGSSDSSGFGLDDFLRDAGGIYTAYTNAQIATEKAAAANTQAQAVAKVQTNQVATGVTAPAFNVQTVLLIVVGIIALLFVVKKL